MRFFSFEGSLFTSLRMAQASIIDGSLWNH
jgi:hypothetical protein